MATYQARLVPEAATALAAALRAADPLVQVRQAGRLAQEMYAPDLAQVVRALARLAAADVDLPVGHLAGVAVGDGPGWWASLVVAETVDDGAAWVGTLAALLGQPPSVVAAVVVRLLAPAGLVRVVRP